MNTRVRRARILWEDPHPLEEGGGQPSEGIVGSLCTLGAVRESEESSMLILGSDHVYQMAYRHLLQFHQARCCPLG
jgi:hypothetical protein